MHNDLRILLNQASIIIAIDTAGKLFTFRRYDRTHQTKYQRKLKLKKGQEQHRTKTIHEKKKVFQLHSCTQMVVFPSLYCFGRWTNKSIKSIIELSWCQHLPHAIVSFDFEKEIDRCNLSHLNLDQSLLNQSSISTLDWFRFVFVFSTLECDLVLRSAWENLPSKHCAWFKWYTVTLIQFSKHMH